MSLFWVFFFFSSRRRHTRCLSDWSSDVCSSDLFVDFAGRARRVIAGADDVGAMRVAAALTTPVWRVGLATDADVRIASPELGERGSAARIELPGGEAVRLALQVPGLHNLRNAAAEIGRAAWRGRGAG